MDFKNSRRNFVAMMTSLVLVLLSHAHISVAKWVEVWSDEFDESNIDDSKWNFEVGDGCDKDLCGWGNNELEWYQKDNAFIDGGHLVIEARKENGGNGKEYTSAKMTTRNKGDWKFGKIEIRAKIARGNGIWPAIWMLPTDEKYGGWPSSGEIDIMENIGKEPTKVHSTMHFGRAWNNRTELTTTCSLPNNQPFCEEYHTYSVEWVQDHIQVFVDDVSITNVTKEQVEKKGFSYPFNERFFLILNVAVGGTWPGDPDNTTQFPQRMEVDYVRVLQQQ